MRRRRYPSDLTDAQWASVAPSMQRTKDSNNGAFGIRLLRNDFVNGLLV
jgi:hypothetical protein